MCLRYGIFDIGSAATPLPTVVFKFSNRALKNRQHHQIAYVRKTHGLEQFLQMLSDGVLLRFFVHISPGVPEPLGTGDPGVRCWKRKLEKVRKSEKVYKITES